MRVAKTGPRREGAVPKSKRREGSPVAEPLFEEVLRMERVQEFDLESALEEIDEYAKQLQRSPVFANLLRYKRKVRDVLLYLVKQSYEVRERTFYDPQGRRRLLVLVENINQKLEELTRDFLDKHSAALDLVSRLDEIRGLLLDLQI